MEQQELEKILSMMRLELSYQLRKFFDNTGSPIEDFSQQCEVSISVISLALDKEPISFSQLDRICTGLHIFLDSLRRAPFQDADYVTMRAQLWELVNSTPDFYKNAIALYPSLHTDYPLYQYERNIAWICFEAEQKRAQPYSGGNPTGKAVLPQSAAALYAPIQDESVREDRTGPPLLPCSVLCGTGPVCCGPELFGPPAAI